MLPVRNKTDRERERGCGGREEEENITHKNLNSEITTTIQQIEQRYEYI